MDIFTSLVIPALVGIGIGILLASGLVTLGIQGLGMLVPGISFLSDYTLSSCMGSLSLGLGGPLGAVHIALVGAAFIASPINCGAIAMVLSLIIVPVVSLFTKRVEFEVDPPHVEGAIDREYEQELEAE